MATELECIKEEIEDGSSWIEALEVTDLEKMTSQGNGDIAAKIKQVLDLFDEISDAAGVTL